MPIPNNTCDNELAKFLEGFNGETVVRTTDGGATPGVYDDIVLSYTGNNLTKVEYKLNTFLIRTLVLTYTGARLDRVVVS